MGPLFRLKGASRAADGQLILFSPPGIRISGLLPGMEIEIRSDDGSTHRARVSKLASDEHLQPGAAAHVFLYVEPIDPIGRVPPAAEVYCAHPDVSARVSALIDVFSAAFQPLCTQDGATALWWHGAILPSFSPDARFGVVRLGDGRHLGLFIAAVRHAEDQSGADPVELPEWNDPIVALLHRHTSLPSQMHPPAVDGIGYTLTLQEGATTTSLDFSNPRKGPFKTIERALWRMAFHLANLQRDEASLEWCEHWNTIMRRQR